MFELLVKIKARVSTGHFRDSEGEFKEKLFRFKFEASGAYPFLQLAEVTSEHRQLTLPR